MARVLLVDDDDDIRETTALRLEMHGHDVVGAADADTARAAIARYAFDIAVLDIDLPTTDGITLLRQLRAEPATAALPVIFYTAHWSAAVAAEAAPLADAYLTKSQSLNRLLETVAGLTAQTPTGSPGRHT